MKSTKFVLLAVTGLALSGCGIFPRTDVVSPKPTTYQVYFDFDHAEIGESAVLTLREVAEAAKQGSVTSVNLSAHSGGGKPDAYNQALSQHRAEAVAAELVKDGVPAAKISDGGTGEGDQLDPTADGVHAPQNRRIEIILR